MKKTIIKKASIILTALIIIIVFFTYFNIKSNQKKRDIICFNNLIIKLENDISPKQIFKEDLEKLQLLVEYSLVSRSKMLKVSNRLKVNKEEPIKSRDLLILKKGSEHYLGIREDLFSIANAYECAIDVEDEILEKFKINQKLRLKGIMLSLGAALTLYDNYFLGVVLFQQDSRLRKIINDPDMGFGLLANKLEEVTLNVNSIETRHRIRRAITFFEEAKQQLPLMKSDPDFEYLELLIESSPSYNYIKKIRAMEIGSNKLVSFERIASDLVSKSSTDGIDIISGLFGNTMGLFESRRGKLYGNNQIKENIKMNLKPLDILLEKTPFRLTDKLIPGHFGHVAIWTGTKAEIIKMNLWDDPLVKRYSSEIEDDLNANSKEKQQIIEALRSGVQLSTLDEFMNIDDFVILRPVFGEKDKEIQQKEALLMAFRQLGKKYDFNFDVNTTDKIVCSELAYVSFPSMDWPTEKTLGRHSISPDNVAKLAWNNLPLELVLFYHDGQLVDSDEQLLKMKELMQN